MSEEIPEKTHLQGNQLWKTLLALLGIFIASMVFYRSILFVPAEAVPWGSDTLGHVLKAQYLQQQVGLGNWYPNNYPFWYMGLQLFRYHPPLPYYFLLAIDTVAQDMVWSASWLIYVCSLCAAWSFMLFRRWMGVVPAFLAGVIFLVLPDHLRVALAEGNLPRVVAEALFVPALYLSLRLLEAPGDKRRGILLSLLFLFILLSHAMMASIYAASLGLLAVLLWVMRKVEFESVLGVIVPIAAGLLLGGAWLVPSLVGGLAGLDTVAVTEALATVPVLAYFDIFSRSNPEVIYVGAALILGAVLSLVFARRREPIPMALMLVGVLGMLVTLPGIQALYSAMPLASLMWPLRFLSMTGIFLLVGLLWQLSKTFAQQPWAVGLVALVLLVDSSGSLPLVQMRQPRVEVARVSEEIARMGGWRQATLDESRLSSEASFQFTATSGREQVFGWAYQGSRTATNVAALNDALVSGHLFYLQDRLNLYGVDDVVILNKLQDALLSIHQLDASGFDVAYTGEELTWLHRDGMPRGVVGNWPILGIGRGAQNLAVLFPQVILGGSDVVDDYSLDYLTRFQAVFVSMFRWNDQGAAEALLREAAARGVLVIVDLTGTPVDPLARIPHFLDVWGEPITLTASPISSGEYTLGPFIYGGDLWHATVPQGLEVEVLTFPYLGQTAALLGYNRVGDGAIWFVGANLVYYAALERDPTAITILSDLLGFDPAPNDYTIVPLANYVANTQGYQFEVALDMPAQVLLPFAAHDGAKVQVNGVTTSYMTLENLLAVDLPAGAHRVAITYHATPLARVAWLVTLCGLLVGAWWFLTPFVKKV